MSRQDKQQLLDAVEGGTGPWTQLMCRRLLCVCVIKGVRVMLFLLFFFLLFPSICLLNGLASGHGCRIDCTF